MNKNLEWRPLNAGEHDVLLYLHTTRPPTQSEWSGSIEFMKQYAPKSDLRRLRVFVVTDGGGPDTGQRSELSEFYKTSGHRLKTAVFTTSLVVRGIVAAVGVLNPHIKAFSPGSLSNALAHLDLPPAAGARIMRELNDMQRGVAPVACLTLMSRLSSTVTS